MGDYESIFFDLDNTLLNFTRTEAYALHKLHRQYFMKTDFNQLKEQYEGINQFLWRELERGMICLEKLKVQRFQRLFDCLKVSHLSSERVALEYESFLMEKIFWFPGVKETLDLFQPLYKMGIITNGLARVQRKKFQKARMNRWFSSIVISEEIGVAKPEKKIFEVACQDLQASYDKSLMIGDSLSSDYQGALNVGMDFCWINVQGVDLPKGFPQPCFTVSSLCDLRDKLSFFQYA